MECRLDTKYPLCNMFRLFTCAVCQVEMKPGQGISIHVGSSKPGNSRPWDGPFLCPSCQEKKQAMEGKRGKKSLSLPLHFIWGRKSVVLFSNKCGMEGPLIRRSYL